MTKLLLGVFMLLTSLESHANDTQKWSHWLTYYYTHKKEDQIPILLKTIDKPEYLSAIKATLAGALPHFMFLSSEHVSFIFSDKTSHELKEIAKEGLYRFDADYLIPEKHQTHENNYASLVKLKPFTPEELDMLWGAFMVTGDIQYVDAVLSALEEKNHILTKQAARWSLFHHMQKHDSVKNRIQDYLDKENPTYEAVKEIWDMYNIQLKKKAT